MSAMTSLSATTSGQAAGSMSAYRASLAAAQSRRLLHQPLKPTRPSPTLWEAMSASAPPRRTPRSLSPASRSLITSPPPAPPPQPLSTPPPPSFPSPAPHGSAHRLRLYSPTPPAFPLPPASPATCHSPTLRKCPPTPFLQTSPALPLMQPHSPPHRYSPGPAREM